MNDHVHPALRQAMRSVQPNTHCICGESGPDNPACRFHGTPTHARLHKLREQLARVQREIDALLSEVA